ncbi:hypothetical protein IV203_017121 [Nitzschia inconspicua]|uniref:TOG domain-containing protein n=1 Tax=Nitzschia inconspicua TaxID=303405 RepID=A0A9K3PIX5_9STRA|nr:hypothetical protein IV203_017121 [Nitzschia inconspicua]
MLTLEVLQALLSLDSARRSQAETVFQSIAVPDRIQALTNHLLALSSSTSVSAAGNNDALSMLTAVLLRRDILKLKDPSMLNDLVEPLLQSYNGCSSAAAGSSQLQIGHCLAEVCSSLSILDNTAMMATSVMAKIVASIQNPTHDVSLRLLASLADRAPMAFTQVAVSSLSTLPTQCNLTSPTTLVNMTQLVVNAAIATTISTVSLVRVAPNVDELLVDSNSIAATMGETCLMPLIGPIANCTKDEMAQLACLQALGQSAVTCPSLLAAKSNVLETTVELCLGLAHLYTIASDHAPVALAAMEVLTSLLSVADVRHRVLTATMAQQISQQVIPVCAQLMSQGMEVVSVQEWAMDPATLVEDCVDNEDEDDAIFAESLMEAFLLNLAAAALNVAMPLVQQLLQTTDDWRNIRAGLAILETGLMAAPVSLASHVPDIIKAATTIAGTSSNPRVQYQAVRLLGALCETHPSVRELYGQVILSHLETALGSPVSKVSAMASMSLVSFCRGKVGGQSDEELDASQFLVPYLSELMQALLKPLSVRELDSGSVTVRVRAMNAVACLAQASGDAFEPFYLQIKNGLLESIQVPQIDIATAALQSVAIVGQAVGKDLFQEDAKTILTWIIPVLRQTTGSVSSSPFATEDLLTGCARISTVLEEDFVPYVESLLPIIYHQAAAAVDVEIEECDESGMEGSKSGDVADDNGTMTVALPGRGFQRIAVNTSVIQEKSANNRVMYEIAKSLGAAFGPYVQKALEVFSPLAKFKYSADVRSTASQTLSALFDVACAYGEQMGDVAIARLYLPLLADSISEQISMEDTSDVEALYASADSLSEIFYIVFENGMKEGILTGLTLTRVEEVVSRCIQTMTSCLERRKNVTQILNGCLTGDDEREVYLAQLRAEDGLLTPLVDSIGYLLKFSKAAFVPIFDKYIVPVLGQFLSSATDVRASVASMLLFDDCVEYCGPEGAAKYAPPLLQGVVAVMHDPSKYDRDLVQAAVYGIAQIVRYAPSTIMTSHVQILVHQLLNISQGSKEEAGDSLYLHEISVSALASMTLFGPFSNLKFVNRDAVMDIFLNNLPIAENFDEAKICHAGLCTLIENGSINPVNDASRITRLIGAILSDVQQEGLDVATPDTCERLTKILYDIHQQNPQAVLQGYASLNGEAQEALSMAIQDFSLSRSNLVTP